MTQSLSMTMSAPAGQERMVRALKAHNSLSRRVWSHRCAAWQVLHLLLASSQCLGSSSACHIHFRSLCMRLAPATSQRPAGAWCSLFSMTASATCRPRAPSLLFKERRLTHSKAGRRAHWMQFFSMTVSARLLAKSNGSRSGGLCRSSQKQLDPRASPGSQNQRLKA